MATRNFQRPETVTILAYIRDLDDVLMNPDRGVTITITSYGTKLNPDSTVVVDEEAMTNIRTGIYRYNWTSSAESKIGWYKVLITATDGSMVSIDTGGFELQ
ncbi:MAG: hypothetical protein RBS96_09130 [Dehalococcoidales bacterium]|jgi:hypothetical protein|nr:hypothetical protein [Dehalococcoidales bacterium]